MVGKALVLALRTLVQLRLILWSVRDIGVRHFPARCTGGDVCLRSAKGPVIQQAVAGRCGTRSCSVRRSTHWTSPLPGE
jgi:hypothetical protein